MIVAQDEEELLCKTCIVLLETSVELTVPYQTKLTIQYMN